MSRAELRRAAVAVILAAATYWVCSAVYRWSPGHHQTADSSYSLAVSETIWRHGTFRLDATLPADRQTLPGYAPETGLPYQLLKWPDQPDAAVYYAYPLGSSLLSAPLVGYHIAKGRGPLEPTTGLYSQQREIQLQQRLASGVTAAVAVVFLLIARCWLSWGSSLLLTLLFAFGSMMWSSMSRTLWSHDWAMFMLAVAILAMAWVETSVTTANRWVLGALLGTSLVWMVLVRPQTALSAAPIGLFLLLRHRRLVIPVGLIGAVWAAGFVALSYRVFGKLTPPTAYGVDVFTTTALARRSFDLLFTPSRGLLVFCPYLVLVVAGLIGFRRTLPLGRGLLLPAVLSIAAQFAMLATYTGWHGGASYGPRYFCDVIPWWFLLAVLAVRAGIDHRWTGAKWWKAFRVGVLSVAVFLACGWAIFVHARGAVSPQAWLWLCRMGPEGENVVRDWDYPQFLGGLTHEVRLDGTIEPRDWRDSLR